MTVQPDGKILLAGDAGRGNLQASSFAVVRYKANGRKDSSFGNGGKTTIDFSNGFDDAFSVALQTDGKVLLAGRANWNSNRSAAAMARLNSDGSLDSTFGEGGTVTTNFLGGQNQLNAIAQQPDGRIVVAGWAGRGVSIAEVLVVARYTSDGSPDLAFGSAGFVTHNFSGRGGEARAIALQPDGKIVVGGAAGFLRAARPNVDFAVVRYNKDGSLDASFGNAGAEVTDFLDTIDEAAAIALQPDGKIVAAGTTGDQSSLADFALARYDNERSFEVCLSDESTGNLLQFNSATGDYQFTACSANLILSGKGAVKIKGCKTTLKDSAADRSVSVTVKTCKNKADASVLQVSTGRRFSISDGNTLDNTCTCP